MFCNEEKKELFNCNTVSGISLFGKAQYLKYVDGNHQAYYIAFQEFKNVLLSRRK